MKIYHVILEIGVEDNIEIDALKSRVQNAIQQDIPEMTFFRVNEITPVKTASGQYRLSLDQAKRLGIK